MSATPVHALPRDASTREALTERDPSRAVLLSGAVVVSLDEEIGDHERADVLIHGKTITAVGPGLGSDPRAEGAIVVDCAGLILAPGFQDTHRHAWQGQLRRFIPDEDQDGYIARMHATMAHHYRPEDMYAGNLVSAIGAIDAGITTMLDFSHNARSAAHSDASIAALDHAGIRAVHTSAGPFDGSWDEQWPGDLARVATSLPASGLVTLRMGLLPKVKEIIPDYLAMSAANLRYARELGLAISVDGAFGPEGALQIELMHADGLLGPDLTLIHCTDITDAAWSAIADSDTKVSLCPTSDAQVGIEGGVPPVQKCIDVGIEPSISIDVEVCLANDMFSQMRALLTIQRMNVFTARYAGLIGVPSLLTDRQVLRMATIAGARANALGDVTGSLTPGKQADIIAVRHDDANVFPLNNAVATLVQGADGHNIECVFVAGRPVKWEREVVSFDLGQAQALASKSREYLFGAAGLTLDILA
jgi:cytosine/adenosine deaminase-related metal-dependent hydrolase